jgi:hypothetical protein
MGFHHSRVQQSVPEHMWADGQSIPHEGEGAAPKIQTTQVFFFPNDFLITDADFFLKRRQNIYLIY